MADGVYTIKVTGDQLEAISELFHTKRWKLNVDENGSRYLERKNIADEYVYLQASPKPEDTRYPGIGPDESKEKTKRRDSSEKNDVTACSKYLERKNVADEYVYIRAFPKPEDRRYPGIESDENKEITKTNNSPEKNGVTIPVDRSQKSFKNMEQTATKYQTLKSSSPTDKAPATTVYDDDSTDVQIRIRKGTWRISSWDPDFKDHVESDIHLQHFCVAEENMLKVITSLSTNHVQRVARVPVRIVLLVDRSGSMLNTLGKDGRHTKITKVKHFAKQLITSLDDGDEAAVVTFGKEAEIFFPLTKITASSRNMGQLLYLFHQCQAQKYKQTQIEPYLMEMLNQFDKGGMSQETNLSAGLRMALKAFFDATKDPSEYLSTKNSIIVFSDGNINAGTTQSKALVHEVRQNIRQMVPNTDESNNQWVTISVITTGSEVSEQAYMLSKNCSSDAYYYIEKEAEDPEAELFIPVLLRKSAVAWNISVLVELNQSLSFVDENCTQDFRIRMRRSLSGKGTKAEKAYFLYDFPAGHSRQIGVCVDLNHHNLETIPEDETIIKLRVEYTNIKGQRLWQEKIINKADVTTARMSPGNIAALNAVKKHDLRVVSTNVCHAAAEHVRGGELQKSKAALMNGQEDIKAMLERFGASAQTIESKPGPELTMYAKSVVDNLGALIECMDEASHSEAWNKIKAVSTAIAREAPNATETVRKGDILCPFPEIEHMETEGLASAMEKLLVRQGKRKRITFGGLDSFLEETL